MSESRETELIKAIIDNLDDSETEYTKTPQSRNEEILVSILNETEYTKTPQSREEELLLELKEKIGGLVPPVPPVIKRVTGNPIEFTDGADAPLVKCVTQITGYQEGTGTPSPENVRPIHAYTENTISVGASANLLDENASDVQQFKTILSDGSIIDATFVAVSGYIPVIPGMSITYGSHESSINPVSGASNGFNKRIVCFDKNKLFIKTLVETTGNPSTPFSISGIIPPNCAYVRVPFYMTVSIMMLNYGTTLLPYQAYSEPTTHTTTYPSSIYRGSEDCVKGEVTSEWGIYVINSFSGGAESNGFRTGIVLPNVSGAYGELYCNMFDRAGSYNDAVANEDLPEQRNKIGFNTSGVVLLNAYVNGAYVTSVQALNALLPPEGCVIAYKLATPTTSSVTPTNLPIKSLSGYNHIESSTGEMQVDYITNQYQEFVNLTNAALPNTRKSGTKAMDIFLSLDNPKIPDQEKVDEIQNGVKEETVDDRR